MIEEARRRQERRRTRLASAAIAATVLIAMLWAFIELPQGRPAHAGGAGRLAAANAQGARASVFNIRLAPVLVVGRVGWEVFSEEHGRQITETTVGPALSSDPYLSSEATSRDGSAWTARLVTTPNVAAVLIAGRTRVPTVSLPGLPYGYRAARLHTQLEGTSLVALDAGGRPLLDKPDNRVPSLAKVRSWKHPGRTPEGSCGLRASRITGLTAQGGQVASAIRPYTLATGRQIVGHAFLPCVLVEYRLGGASMRALVLLDANHPSARAAALPDFKPVSGTREILEEGRLMARREGNAWLVVGGGGPARRIELLRHLSALVGLDSGVPASAGLS